MSKYRFNKRYISRLFLVFVLVVTIAFSIDFFGKDLFGRWGPSVDDTVSDAATQTGTLPNNNGLNILIIGNNARDATGALSLGSAGGQADILIVAHIDTASHEVTLVSIPRDTLVALPDWNEPIPKIKSAFNLGLQQSPQEGADMAMLYAAGLTGMPINNYVAIDFQGFVDAVNAVGGVSIDVPARLYDPLNSGADLYPGWQVLNGDQALAYVRIRQNQAGNNFRVNDFQRQQAELQVLKALKDKVLKSYSNIFELSQLVQILNKDVSTNLGPGQIISLARESLSWHVNYVYLGSDRDAMDIASAPVTGLNSGGYITGAYYDVLDPEQVYTALKPYGASAPDSVLPALPQAGSVAVEVYGPAAAADELRNAGFTRVDYRGPASNVSQDTVIYPPGQLFRGLAVGRACGAGNELVEPGPAGLNDILYLAAG